MPIDFQPLDNKQAPAQQAGSPVIDFHPLASNVRDSKTTNTGTQAPEVSTGHDKNANVPASIVSGLSNAGSNMLFEGPINAVAWLGEHLGAIDPKIADRMKKEVHSDAEKWFKSSDETPAGDVFNESRMKYPAASAIPQAVTEVGLLSKASPPSFNAAPSAGLLAKIGTKALSMTAQGATNAVESAGISGGSTENQDSSAAMGVALPAVLSGAGSVIKAGARALEGKVGLINKLKSVVNPINQELAHNNQLNTTEKAAASVSNMADAAKKIENENYSNIKNIPGTIETAPIQKAITELASNNPRMSADNIAVLEDALKQTSTIKTMEDAINLKQALSRQQMKFKNTTDSLYAGYKDVVKGVDSAIAQKAEAAGLKGDWQLANKYHYQVMRPMSDSGAFDVAQAFKNKDVNPQAYADAVKTLVSKAKRSPEQMKATLQMMDSSGSKIMEQDIIKSVLDDINVNPEAFDKNKALRTMNTFINKFSGTMSTDSISAMKGVKTILHKAGATEAKTSLSEVTNSSYFQHSLGAGLGAALGAPLGPAGSVVGSIAGIGMLPPAIKLVTHLIESPTGLAVLKSIGTGRPWTKHLSDVLRSLSIEAAGNANKESPDAN